MYLAPFVGIGVGYLIDVLVDYISGSYNLKKKFVSLIHVFLIVLLLGVNVLSTKQSYALVARPKITPGLEADFLRLSEITPEDSWIWTWWDYGTAIQYLSNRAVFHDGQSQTTPKTYFVATTFSASDSRQAYNTILGISSIGLEGISKLEKRGFKGEVLRDKLFKGEFSKPLKHPVYWAFTGDEIGKFGWINYFGTWDFNLKRGINSPIYQLSGCNMFIEKGKRMLKCREVVVDLTGGKIYQGSRQVPLRALIVKAGSNLKREDYNPAGLYVEIVKGKKGSYVFLLAHQPFRSMFNQMYILRNYDGNYFELVYDDFPTMVLYRVR
jgi:dolichyl-diphosphooligosaccharide--protein glycosyltransferase